VSPTIFPLRLGAFLTGLFALAAGCGGKTLTESQPDALAPRVPQNHRAAGATCPAARAAGTPTSTLCGPDGGSTQVAVPGPRLCDSDTDCTAGTNGRCNLEAAPFSTCATNCSYDACQSDSDCPDNQPCDCRGAATSAAANSCLTGGNCRVDSDCGPGGFCSPSQVDNFCFCPSPALCAADAGLSCFADGVATSCACGDSCGHSYYCHTHDDTCVDDADCTGDGTCNYDTVNLRWSCSVCWPVI
jgi:hypothetical protein